MMRWSLLKRSVKSQGKAKPAAGRRLGRWRIPLSLEILEDRTLLSVVHWISAGSGDWNTAANWDAGHVPGSADDVVLNAPGNVTVTHSGGDHTVHSLQGSDALVLSGGSLTITAGASQLSGALTVAGAMLTATGTGTSFTATGTTSINGANLYATGGATLALPAATSYAGPNSYRPTLQASGANSKLDLSHLTTLKGAYNYNGVYINAYGGGTVDFSGVTSNPGGDLWMTADGAGSLIALPQLASLASDGTYGSSLTVQNGGAITIPKVTTLSRVNLTISAPSTLSTRQITTYISATITANGTTPDFSGLTNIDGSSLYVNGGGTLAFPNVTSYAGPNSYRPTLQANGANSKLDLSHVTTLKGAYNYNGVYINALGGGTVDFSGVTSNPGGDLWMTADGAGSLIALAQVARFASDGTYGSSLTVQNNGAIAIPRVTALSRVNLTISAPSTLATRQITSDIGGTTITVNGGAPDFSGLTTMDGSSFYVNGGGTLALPGVTSYTGPNNYRTTLQASGANSKLDLSHVTTLKGAYNYNGVYVNAYGGGTVDFSGVTSNPGGDLWMTADGAGSLITLSQLPRFASDGTYGSSLTVQNGGAIAIPKVTTLSRVNVTISAPSTLATRQITSDTGGTTITVNGAAPDFSGLTTIDGLNLYVNSGGTLALPGVTSYTGANYDTTLQANGASSKLDLSHLTKLIGANSYADLHVNAYAGGKVDLSNVTSNPNGRTSVLVDGANSLVDLSNLSKMVSDAYWNSSLEARNSGTLTIPLLTTLNRVDVTVNANATLATHQITSYTGATITDNGATPDFSGLTTIDGLNLYVNGGGTLTFPGVTSYTGANYDTTLQANGANSKLDLSHLTKLIGGNSFADLHVNAYNGGQVNLSGVSSNPSGRTSVLVDGANSLVNLSNLPKMLSDAYWNSSLEARNSGTLTIPLLTTLNRVDITVNANATLATRQITTYTAATITDNGATPDFSGLTTIDGSSLVVNGGTLAFPGVTSYTGANYDTTLQANGGTSKLDLSHLTKLTGASSFGDLHVNAYAGGKVDLSNVSSNPNGRTSVLVDGANSLVDLSQLPKMISDAYWNSSLEARNSGTIKIPLLTALNRVDVTLDGSDTPIGNAWTTFMGGTLTINGGSYTLPKLADFLTSSLNLNGGTLAFAQGTVGTINLSTGLDSSGQLLTTGGSADAHWAVGEANGTTAAAQTVFPNNPDWYGGWPANGPTSDWIARDASTRQQGSAPYTFTRTFDLTGYNLSTVALSGTWGIDDTGTLALNGHVIDTESNPWSGGSFPALLVPAANGFFNQGLNTLTITITASDNYAEGVRLDAAVVGDLGTANGLASLINSNITVHAGATLNFPAGKTTLTRTNINGIGGTITAGTIELVSGSNLGGTGTIVANVLNSSGQVRPAGGPGILQISGDFTQTANGVLTMDIGGLGAGQFGRLAVTGTATLDGTLNINLTNGYYPANGVGFQGVTASTLSGRFATINGLTQNGRRTFQITYRPTNFALVTVLDDLYPDLQVANLATNPASGLHSASTLTITWSDSNTGKAATPTGASWYDRVVVKNLTTGQTLLNTIVLYDATARGPIGINGAQAQQDTYTLPPGTPGAGQIEIDVTVNTFNDVFEFNDAGTADANNTATITKSSTVFVPAPDVRPVNLLTIFPGPKQSGAVVTVSWDDANQGNTATSGSFTDTVVVVNTTTGKTIAQVSLPYVETAAGNGPIAVNDHRGRQVTLTLPDGADSVGNLTFTITTDAFHQLAEPDYSHNTATATAAVTLAPYPDLQVNNLRTTPATGLQSGTSLVISWDDANPGSGATPAAWSDSLTITNRTTGQTLLATLLPVDPTVTGAIPAGGSLSRQYAFTLPNGPAGVGTIDITVTADASNSFFEYHAGGANPNKQMTTTQTATLAAYPDLTVTQVQAPATVQAGRSVPLTWTVANQGSGAAQGTWIDQVFVSADQRTDDGLLVATFTYSGPLAAHQSVTRSEMVPIPSTGLTGNYWFYVRTNGDQRLFELNLNNNTLLASQATAVQAGLTLTLSVASIAKDAGSLPATISRNGNLSAPLIVNLVSSNPSQLTVPATVTIPAGLATASFTVMVIQDGLADGNQNVTITATAAGLQSDMHMLQVIDVNKPTLTVTLASGQIKEGDPSPATTGRVTRNTPTTQPLVVTLITNDSVRMVLPATVTIPAGQASATFPIDAQHDFFIEGPRTVMIQATAGGFVNTAVPLTVVDIDVPQLGLALAAGNVLKNAPNPATFGVVSQGAAAPHDLVVQLVSSDPGKIMVPGQVVILAGQTTASFPITVVDNHLADGTQNVTITAYVTTTNGNVQLSQGSASAHINLLDYHQPAVQVVLARDVAAVNSTVIATLSRAQAAPQALTVNLASSNTAAVTVPAMVTIPANQTSVMFNVTALAKAVQPVTISATATGFNPGSAQLLVTDQSLPDLKITSVVIPATGLTLDQFTVNFRVDNLGLAPAFGTWTDQVYLSPTGLAKDGTLLGTFPFTADPSLGFPVGLYYQKALPFALPNTPGAYWVIVTTNAGNTLVEGLTTNNTTVSAQPIQVTPAYTATVHASLRMGIAGQPVTLSGTATKAGSSAAAPFVPVTVRVQLRNTRRVLTALTDANGHFAVVFYPLPGEGGHYQIGAAYPQDPIDPIQDQFTLVGMAASPTAPSVSLVASGTANGSLSLNNLTEVPLTGIAATVLGAATDLNVQVNVGTNLPGSGALPVTFSVKSLDSAAFQGTLYLHFASTEGAALDVPLQVTVNRLVPSLTANPGTLVAGVLRGGESVVSVTVTNQGGAASGDLSVLLSQLSWLTLSSPATIHSLNPGQSTTLSLTLLPPVSASLGNYSGSIVLRGAATNLTIPFTFRTLSDATGNLTITTVDEYTFYAAGAPNLAGAHVTLLDSLSNSVIAQGTTDSAGHLTIPQVREGYYTLNIQADKHLGYQQSILVQAGSDNPVQAFLPRQTVQYSWTVVPTHIQDQTTIQIQATFETNVPVPVITVDPPLIDLSHMQVGATMEVDLTVTNHGLIAANEGQLHLGSDPRYRVTSLITDFGVIPAMSSLTIPVLFQRLSATGPQGQDGGGCGFSITVTWSLICGNAKESYGTSVTLIVTPENCGGPGSVPQGGGGGPGGAFYLSGAVSAAPCNPCGLKIAKDILSAAFWDLLGRIPRGIGDAITLAHDFTDLYNKTGEALHSKNPDIGGIEIGMASTGVDLAKAIGREVPGLSEALTLLGLANDIFRDIQECQKDGGGGGEGPGAQDDGLPPDAEALLTKEVNRLQTVLDGLSAFFGDSVWLRGSLSANFQPWLTAFLSRVQDANGKAKPISDADRAALLQMPQPSPVAAADVNKFLDRWNRTLQYWGMGIIDITQVPQGQSKDFWAIDDLLAKSAAVDTAYQASAADGYPQILDGMTHAIQGIYDNFTQKNGGVCARVRLEIDQQAVLTRDAFNATLGIADNEDTPLTNVKVDVHIFNAAGMDVTNLFGILPPQLSNLSAVDGTGKISAGTTGQASWILIPSINAAPDQPTQYFVSATLSYSDMGVPIVVPMDRTQITVYPQAQLSLNYFFQRDVFGPDPFSDTQLPSEPFSLGVIVSNTGKGTAQNVSITSAQPRIVDNEKGLLVNFNIIATEVNGLSLSPDLMAILGNIAPGKTAVGRWLFTSSLAGHFMGYTATFHHTDALGGQQLSLIQNVQIHELIHVVHMTTSGLPDFLVDDRPSSLHLPDTLYLGDGRVAPVTATGLGRVDAAVSTSHLQVQLTATMPAGYGYLQIPDPGNGNFHLVRVVRSDGTEIAVNDNIWETDLTFPDGGLMPVKENLLHLLDFNSSGSYTLYYAPNDPSPPQVASIDPVVPNPRSTAVTSIDVTLSKPVDPATFDYRALTLTRNGSGNLITNAVTVQLISGAHYRINGLSGLTGIEGNYVLTVSAAGLKDPLGIGGTGSVSVSWTTAIQAPTIASITGAIAGQRNTPVTSIVVEFTKPINGITVDYHALTLTRNGGGNLITSAVTVTQVDFTHFRFDGLTGLTAIDGHYVLIVDASKVKDATGVTGVGAVTITWDLSTANPTVVDASAPSGTVNQTVDFIDVTFSKVIDPATFTTAALALTRNGGANLITPAVMIQQLSPTQFRVSGLTGLTNVAGTYLFVVNAATVRDLAGNPGTGSVSKTWVLTTTAPAAATNIVLTPHFGMPPNDNITNTLTPMLAGQLGATGLTVSLFDVTNNRDLGQATVNGMSFSRTLTFTTAGNHQVRIRVSNAAGTFTDSFYSLVIDVTPPTVSQLINVPAGSTTKSVASIDVVFSKPIQAATFDRTHLSLTRNGGANLISSAVTVTFVSGTTYRISGLCGLTQAKGTYLLTINLAGIQDLYGNVAGGISTAAWSNVLVASPLELRLTEGLTFTGVVATLSDGDANTQAGSYTVQIAWGDGTTTTGTVQSTAPDNFNLLGNHAYAEEGNYPITVTVRDQAGNTATASSTVAVADAALHAQGQTLQVSAGQALTNVVVATFTDDDPAAAVGDFTATINWGDGLAATSGTIRFNSQTQRFEIQGSHIGYSTAGTRTLGVSLQDAGGAGAAVNSPLTVNPAATSRLVVAGFPASVTAGVAGTITVTALDAYGNVTPAYRGIIHFGSTDIQAVLPTDYTFAAGDNGVHTFSGLILKTAATQSLTATDTTTGSITGTQSGIVVTPAATSMLAVAGFPSPMTAGVAGAVTVTAVDPFGNATPTYRGTIHFRGSDLQAVLPTDYTFVAADNGSHTFSGVILKTAASQSLTATDTGTGAFTGTQSGIVVTPAAADHFQVDTLATTVAGQAFDVTVTALDPYGNVDVNYAGTITFSSSDAMAALPPDYTFTAGDAGVVTFAGGATLFLAGPQAVTVTDVDTGLLIATSNILVTPAAADHFQVDAAASSVAGQAFDVTVTVQDAYGNTAADYTGTVTFSSQNPYGATVPADYTFTVGDNGMHTFTGGATLYTAGTWDFTATDTASGITGSANVTVMAAAVDHFLVTTSVDGSSTVAGTPFDVTLTAQDAYGNTATDYTGTVTFSSQDPYGAMLPPNYTFTTGGSGDNGVHTFAAGATLYTVGTWDVTATDTTSGVTGNANVTATPAAAVQFQVTTSVDGGSTVAGTPFDVTVTALDPYGNIDTNYQGTVTFTSTDAAATLPVDYTFTAGDAGMHVFAGGVTLVTAGSQDITATDTNSGITGSATVQVTPAAADHFLLMIPSQAVAGEAFDVTVVALDPYGNIDVNYQGMVHFSSTDPDPGVILPDDYTFTAADQGMHTWAGGVTLITLGDQTLTVTDVDSGITGSAVVTVTDAGGLPRPAENRWQALPVAEAATSPASAGRSWSAEPGQAEEVGRDRFFAALAESHRPRENGIGNAWLDNPLI